MKNNRNFATNFDYNMKKVCDFIARWMGVLVLVMAVVSFLLPEPFSKIDTWLINPMLGLIMFGMGLTLNVNDFKVVFCRPKDVLIGCLAQFTIMPLMAWVLTKAFELPADLALGVILVGCCPGGTASNVITYLAKGDLALSVGMTATSTLLAPLMTPFLTWLMAGTFVDVDAWGMFQQILIVTIIPIAIGFLLNVWLGHKDVFRKIQDCMPGLSVTCLACIVGGVVTTVHDPLVENGLLLFLLTFGMVFCHNTIGYLLGYAAGSLCHFSVAKKRTLSIEVCMQNAGLGTNLAMTFFVATNPMAVVPCAISCAWHSISGTILANIFAHKSKN